MSHLTEESYAKLSAGEEFPGAEELLAHLDSSCPQCDAFLGERRPDRPPARPAAPRRVSAGAKLARSMQTENLAIVFTDIKGFTERTSRQTRAENERLLKVHE